MNPETKRGLTQYFIKSIASILLLAVLIFLSAGDWTWPGGWMYLALTLTNFILAGFVLIPQRPELLARRGQVGKGTPGWDRLLAPLMAYGPLYIGLISGLVYRFTGGDEVSSWLRFFSGLVAISGSLLISVAMLHNPFFEATVRIQSDQGHQVASSGPYKWVRHPGYLGTLLYGVPAPFIFGVYWGFAGAAVFVVALVIRTTLEDRYLRENLDGYAAYAQETPHRLIPYIW